MRDCLGTLFRNSLTVGSLKKINNLFIKDIFHGYCLKRQSLNLSRSELLDQRLDEPPGDAATLIVTVYHQHLFPIITAQGHGDVVADRRLSNATLFARESNDCSHRLTCRVWSSDPKQNSGAL